MLLYAIIFLSGAAILALELLASRVMTPYFGVSLYIWTGILSITLISLALGYWAGGKLAQRTGAGVAKLTQLFALMPALAALGIAAACLAYPFTYAPLASFHLVLGAFVAALVLLFVPLVTASAMNPLLVAICLEGERRGAAGDAGAGKVFFVSTIGSVVGVFATAFLLIPFVSNFSALLIVALVLALLTVLAAAARPQIAGRGTVATVGVIAAVAAGALLAGADAYTGRQGPYTYGGVKWQVEGSYGSLFGTVKVLRSEAAPDGRFLRLYFQDGLTQNMVDSQNRSSSFYTYALEALARTYQPKMHGALVLGLGAGMVPMRLAALGVPVEVVDIDPAAPRVAERYFGFSKRNIVVHQADARTFVQRCDGSFDVAVVDLFNGDGTPDYLVTRQFFGDLKRCLARGGVAVFNTFADLEHPEHYAHFLATLKSELPHLVLYRPSSGGATHVNSFVVAAAAPLPAPASITFDYLPTQHDRPLWEMLSGPMSVTAAHLKGGHIITDARNPAAHDLAQMQLTYRKTVVQAMPAPMLLN